MGRPRRDLVIFGLMLLILAAAPKAVPAQRVDSASLSGYGMLLRHFRNAASDAGRSDWPANDGHPPGTRAQITFDARNADITVVEQKEYGLGRLVVECRRIAVATGYPNADFHTYDGTHTIAVDIELNKYMRRGRSRSAFSLDLSRTADAFKRSSLPLPVVFGIDGTDATRAVLMSGSSPRNIDGYWFAAVSEIPEGSRIDFRASVTPAQIAIAAVFGLFLLGLMIMIPIGLWRKSAAVARSPQLDREALQQRYDRAKPAWMMLLPAMALPFLLIAGTQRLSLTRAIGNVISFSPVPIGAVMAVLGVACFGSLALSTVLMRKRAAQVRSETGGTAPAQTSARISLAFLPIFVVAFCVLLLQMAPVYSSQGLRYRLYALIGLLAAAIVTSLVLARRQAKAMRAVLREGPWFDMVQELSVTAGVRVRAVTLLDLPAANAYATAFQTIGLTRGLIEQLEPAEVRAVIAHEMAHLKLGHPQRTLWVSLAISSLVYGGFAAVSGSIAAHLGREAADLARNPILFFLPLNIVVLLLTGRGRRRRELEADRLASRWIGDPELVAAALTRVHELNASPYRLKKSDEAISTHPSLEKRLAALKENGDK